MHLPVLGVDCTNLTIISPSFVRRCLSGIHMLLLHATVIVHTRTSGVDGLMVLDDLGVPPA